MKGENNKPITMEIHTLPIPVDKALWEAHLDQLAGWILKECLANEAPENQRVDKTTVTPQKRPVSG